ncbi:MAG: hypothetical protein APF76_11865 [Desulfitibacter sp. BRH_c19]|nr:MAG: hypothetical protein APF76_11865 [Desulfitibacter sp. BRH_c19]
MLVKRNSFTYLTMLIIVMILGLGTRYFSVYLPNWITLYLGDTLWALMVFFLFGFIFKTAKTRWIVALTLLFSFSIEISQLYHSQWIDALRQTRLGGLVLGYGFLWSDLVSYSIGIVMGVFVEKFIFFNSKP